MVESQTGTMIYQPSDLELAIPFEMIVQIALVFSFLASLTVGLMYLSLFDSYLLRIILIPPLIIIEAFSVMMIGDPYPITNSKIMAIKKLSMVYAIGSGVFNVFVAWIPGLLISLFDITAKSLTAYAIWNLYIHKRVDKIMIQ